VQGTVKAGDVVTITTQAGKTWQARVERVLWTGDGVSICATASTDRPAAATRSRGRGRWTGCSCGSREDAGGELIPSERNCRQCEFDAYDN
jgi:hypothetical protein